VHLARHLGIPIQRVNELVNGKRGVTPETAWLLAQAFGTTPEFWANLQMAHDLARHRPDLNVGPVVSRRGEAGDAFTLALPVDGRRTSTEGT
jgi:addiction module HigA family antidote